MALNCIQDAKVKFRRGLFRLCHRLSERTIAGALRRLSKRQSRCLLVHSSLSHCGYIPGGPATLVKLFKECASTVCMPTHTYCYPAALNVDAPVFDIVSSHSLTGAVTDYFRKLPHVQRSLHPTHSLACMGPDAAFLIADHEHCDTPCGPGTPYQKLVDIDSSVLMFGATMNTYTLFHTAEAEVAPEYLYCQVPCDLRARDGSGKEYPIRMWRQNMAVPRRFEAMDAVLESEGLLRREHMGMGSVLFVPSARSVHNFVVEGLRRDPGYLLLHPATGSDHRAASVSAAMSGN